METEKYRALLCVLEKGTLSGAAEEMGYTPSGISRMITALEDMMGLKLLLRTQKGVMATAECEKLIPSIRELVRREEGLFQEIDEIKGLVTGNITIGTSMDAYFPMLSQIAAAFIQKYPGVSVEITDGLSETLVKKIETHQLDFAIVSRREGEVRWIPLLEDPLVALVNNDSEYASLQALPVKTFRKEPFIDIYHSDKTDNRIMFQRNGIEPKLRHSCANSYAAAAMIEAGLGITVENHIIAKRWGGQVKLLPLEPPQYVEIGIAAPKKNATSPAAEKFLEFAREQMEI